ncbi:MAG: leucine-rich repeat domain-containing protein [Clostridia bacterium]|nr:leucine-rich repeat domain-containing protein [Clostridia bacterium]
MKIKYSVILWMLILVLLSVVACDSSDNHIGSSDTTTASSEATVTTTTTSAVTTTTPMQSPCVHSYSGWTVIMKATCTVEGVEQRKCSSCNATQNRSIAKVEHTIAYTDQVEPTCSSTGLTQATFCSVCKTVISPSHKIDKLPHTMVEGVCTVCGEEGGSQGLQYVWNGDKQYVHGIGSCTDTVIYIPTEKDGEKVYGVHHSAFKDQTQITKVIFQSGHTFIDTYAFAGCTSLEEVVLPDTLEVIGSNAFEGCTALTEIRIPASVRTLQSAFTDSNIQTVIFEEGLETLPAHTFTMNDYVKTVVLPKSLKIIGDNAFNDCSGIESLTIPASVEVIGDGAFRKCEWLKGKLDLSNVRSIGRNAFYATKITELVLGETAIGDRSFKACRDLRTITLGEGVTAIGAEAFGDCKELVSIYIPDSVKLFGANCFEGCSALYFDHFTVRPDMQVKANAFDSVHFETLTVQINTEKSAFYGAIINRLIIDEGVTEIGDSSYLWAEVNSISLPTTLEKIGESAFHGVKVDEIEVRSAVTFVHRSFNNFKVKTMILPEGIVVKDRAFCNMDKLNIIYYGGTQAQWNAIYENYGTVESDKDDLKNVTVICSDTQ